MPTSDDLDAASSPSGTTGTAATPPVGRRTGWRSWLRRGLLVVMLGFAAVAIARNREELAHALRELSPATVAASFVPAVLAMLASLMVWRSVLADLGAPLPLPAAARVFYLSQLGKYVPGAVWSIASQMELTRELNVPRRTSLAGGVLTIAVSISVGLPVAAVTLPLAAPDAARRFWWAFAVVPVLLAMLHPAVLGRLLDAALRLIRRPPLPARPTVPGLLRAAAWQVVVWLLLGTHAWLLIVGIGAPAGRALPVAIGGYALAYSIGLLSLLPSGAGIRDAALTLALSAVIAAPAALVVALVSRTVLTVVDLAMAGVQYAIRLHAR